ncbi:hypothetical protein NF867_09275 [Solitalea sp. MAHUQ-68]|uniref:Uncharacterized protein n=1 Tax=Solitalea agri TaxID=2953739 RepID=A0A9X2F9S0_9SPHI|nr:hypothetical protein [Solitalea agri]MCO4293053.1 hypothetical protein [Solitalea agri]
MKLSKITCDNKLRIKIRGKEGLNYHILPVFEGARMEERSLHTTTRSVQQIIKKVILLIFLSFIFAPPVLLSQVKRYNAAKPLFVASGSSRLNKNADFRTTFEINYLNALYKERNLSVKQAKKEISEFRSVYDKYFVPPNNSSAYDYYHSFLNLGSSISNVAEKAKVSAVIDLVKSASSTTKLIYDDFTSIDPDQAKEINYAMFNFDRIFRNNVLETAYDHAEENGNYRQAFNLLFSRKVGHNINEVSEEILQNDPELARELRISDLAELVQQAHDGTVRVEDLTAQLKSTLKGMEEMAVESNNILKEINQNRLRQDSLQYIRQTEELKIEAAYASVSILSNLAKVLGNDKLANQISVIGNSTINITNAINKFKDVKNFATRRFMGSLVLSATIFSSVIDIFSLFDDPGPNPLEVLSDQLKQISEQIDVLRSEMHERFNIVDYKLDIIYSNLIRGFGILFEQQQQILGKLATLKQSVDDVNENVLFYGRNISNKLDNNFLSQLWTYLSIINNRKDDELGEEQFLNIRDELYTYGIMRSKIFSQTFAVERFDESNNLTLYDLLKTSHTLNTNYNCLKDILSYRFRKNVPGYTIPDLNIWLVASNALLKLTDKWPNYTINNDALSQLIATGEQIQSFSKINFLYNYKSKKYQADTSIIDTLIDTYKQAALNLIRNEFKSWEMTLVRANYNNINPDSLPQKTTLSFPITIDYASRKSGINDFKKIQDTLFVDKLVPDKLKLLEAMGIAKTTIYIEIRFKPDSTKTTSVLARWPNDHYVWTNDTLAVAQDFVLNYNTSFKTQVGYQSKLQSQIVIPLNEFWGIGVSNTDGYRHRNLRTNFFMQNFAEKYVPAILAATKGAKFYNSDVLNNYIDSVFAVEIAVAKATILDGILQHTFSDKTTFIRKLNFNYELVKAYTELTFPQSMSDDDTLIGFFYGKNAMMSTDNLIYQVSKFKTELLNNPTNYTVINFENMINKECDRFKKYFVDKLKFTAETGNFEKVSLLDLTIKNLKILQAKYKNQ